MTLIVSSFFWESYNKMLEMFCHKTGRKVSDKYFITPFISHSYCRDIILEGRNVSSHAMLDILNHFAVLSYMKEKRKLNYFMTEKCFSFLPMFRLFPFLSMHITNGIETTDINKFLESLNNFSVYSLLPREKAFWGIGQYLFILIRFKVWAFRKEEMFELCCWGKTFSLRCL